MSLSNAEIFLLYKRRYRRSKVFKAKNQGVFSGFLTDVFQAIVKEMLYNGYIFTFRALGKFYTIKSLPKYRVLENGDVFTNAPVNFHETLKAIKETGDKSIKIYFDNSSTGNYIYTIYWEKGYGIRNKKYYRFKTLPRTRKQISKAIHDGEIIAKTVEFKN